MGSHMPVDMDEAMTHGEVRVLLVRMLSLGHQCRNETNLFIHTKNLRLCAASVMMSTADSFNLHGI